MSTETVAEGPRVDLPLNNANTLTNIVMTPVTKSMLVILFEGYFPEGVVVILFSLKTDTYQVLPSPESVSGQPLEFMEHFTLQDGTSLILAFPDCANWYMVFNLISSTWYRRNRLDELCRVTSTLVHEDYILLWVVDSASGNIFLSLFDPNKNKWERTASAPLNSHGLSSYVSFSQMIKMEVDQWTGQCSINRLRAT